MEALVLLLAVGLGIGLWWLQRVLGTLARQREALARSERDYRTLADRLPDVVVRMDRDGRHLYANAAVEGATGLPPAAFIGKTNAELGMPAQQVDVWMATLRRAFERGASERIEFGYPGPDGWRHWESVVTPEPAPAGPARTALVISRDITERRRDEAALQDSEARFRALFDASPVPTLACERGSLRLLAVNEAFTQLYGYSRDEALALRVPDLYPAEAREQVVELAARVQGLDHATDLQHLCKDGRRIDVEIRSHDYALDGRPGRISVIVDVTEQRRAEAERRAAAGRFEKLFQAAPEAISVSDFDDGRFLHVNDAFCELFGRPREQVIGRTAAELQMWSQAPAREVVVQRLLAGEPVQGFEGAARRGDGEAVDVLFSAERIAFGGHEALLLMFRDISQRKRLEAALQASEARLGHLLARAPTVIYTAHPDGDFGATYFSPNLPEMLGWQPRQFIDEPSFWLDHVHPEDRPGVVQAMATIASRDDLVFEYRFQHADGGWRWVRDHLSVQRDAAGRPVEIVGAWLDISARREAEQQVRRLADELEQRVQQRTAQLALSESRLRAIFENVPVAISEEDWSGVQRLLRGLRERGVGDGPAHFAAHPEFVAQCLRAVRILRLNRKALSLHDAQDQQRDLPDLQAFYPEPKDLAQFVGELEALWVGRRTYTAKRLLPSVSGRPLNLMMTILLPALDGDDPLALVCLVDITEIDRLNAELDRSLARLRQVNKELETFTYSVSHDLKAPLRGIDGYSRLLLTDHAQALDDEGRQFLGHIRQATQHMGVLIDDLLAYSRLERSELRLAALRLAATVDAVLAPWRADLAARGVELTVDVDAGLRATGDAQGLAIALRNLVDNALKFTRDSRPARVHIGAARIDACVRLSVRDNGPGFDMKFHDRIFAIFQRLHRAEDYPGTGVGLAIVRKAMERMGGRAWADSAPGAGATFHLELPAAD